MALVHLATDAAVGKAARRDVGPLGRLAVRPVHAARPAHVRGPGDADVTNNAVVGLGVVSQTD